MNELNPGAKKGEGVLKITETEEKTIIIVEKGGGVFKETRDKDTGSLERSKLVEPDDSFDQA